MKFQKRKPGYALATILVLLGVSMFGVGALITVSTLESKISRSQQESVTAYYVSEGGVQDALWRINTTPAYKTALAAGTLNVTYTATNAPATNQGYTVTMKSSVGGGGYGTIDVTGTSDNGVFVSKRRVVATVFEGAVAGGGVSPTGTAAMFSGAAIAVNNPGSTFSIAGGDFYAGGGITFNQTTVNLNGGVIKTPGPYNSNQTTLQNSGGVFASSCSPTPAGGCQAAPSTITAPSFDFTYYSTHYTTKYTAAQFQTAVSTGGATVNFPGPVTYITGDVNIGNWMKNKTVNISGMLIIAGSLGINNSATNAIINVNDPGTGQAGIFVSNNINNGYGTWNINGVFYAAGSTNFSSAQTINVNGALISAGPMNINTGFGLTLTYNSTRTAASFAGASGVAQALSVQYWEEQY